MITLVYSSDTHMCQLSQLLVSDPNLRPLFKGQEISVRESIERFITLTQFVLFSTAKSVIFTIVFRSFALGVASFEPGDMSIEDLLHFAVDHNVSANDKKGEPGSASTTPKPGSSTAAAADKQHNGAKSSKGASAEAIHNYCRYATWFIKNCELPGDLSLKADRNGLRSVARLLLKSLFGMFAYSLVPHLTSHDSSSGCD